LPSQWRFFGRRRNGPFLCLMFGPSPPRTRLCHPGGLPMGWGGGRPAQSAQLAAFWSSVRFRVSAICPAADPGADRGAAGAGGLPPNSQRGGPARAVGSRPPMECGKGLVPTTQQETINPAFYKVTHTARMCFIWCVLPVRVHFRYLPELHFSPVQTSPTVCGLTRDEWAPFFLKNDTSLKIPPNTHSARKHFRCPTARQAIPGALQSRV